MRKPALCIYKTEVADQLPGYGNRAADQRLLFRYMDSTIPLLSKSKISSIWLSTVVVQLGVRWTLSETAKTGFLASWLIWLETGFLMLLLNPSTSLSRVMDLCMTVIIIIYSYMYIIYIFCLQLLGYYN